MRPSDPSAEHTTAYVTVVASGSEIASIMDDGSVELEFDAEVDHVDWHDRPEGRRIHTFDCHDGASLSILS